MVVVVVVVGVRCFKRNDNRIYKYLHIVWKYAEVDDKNELNDDKD